MAPNKKIAKTQEAPAQNGPLKIVVENDMVKEMVADLEKRFIAETANFSGRPVVLDLSKVHQIDSKGITLCIGLFKECQAKGCAFSMIVNTDLYRFFCMLKLTKVIDIHEVAAA